MKEVTATELKRNCLRLLDEVEMGEELLVTKRGKPLVYLMPIRCESSTRQAPRAARRRVR